MKTAIASEDKDIDSEISPRGGRAPYYLIFEDNKLVETIKNPFAVGSGGAGWSVAHLLAEKKVDLVIAGKIGPNMQTALKEKAIEFREETGKKIKEIIK
ncbi:NifB/NifX family molybdenum-iron cluster-binding protein [Candidatus Pacearchaeota archaeon]|nr:NifB/NifX family molybdenum-iron cluster-binding protein [Candidatus Pacearchaeota archaeon]